MFLQSKSTSGVLNALGFYECECGGKYELNISGLAVRMEMKVAMVAVMMTWLSHRAAINVEASF